MARACGSSSRAGRPSLHQSSYPDLDGARAEILLSGVAQPVARASGTEVYFEDGDRIMLTTSPELALGQPETLYVAPGIDTGGRRFDVDHANGVILIIKAAPRGSAWRPELLVVLNRGERVRTACRGE